MMTLMAFNGGGVGNRTDAEHEIQMAGYSCKCQEKCAEKPGDLCACRVATKWVQMFGNVTRDIRENAE